MSQDWSDKELKLLKKLVKKKKSSKQIAETFEKKKKKGYNKNIFQIISQMRSMPELRPYFQKTEITFDDLDGFLEAIQKKKNSD